MNKKQCILGVAAALFVASANGCSGADGDDGADGANGSDGADGVVSLVESSSEPAGENCEFGGVRFEAGIDANGDGVLDASEVTDTEFFCELSNNDARLLALELITGDAVDPAPLSPAFFPSRRDYIASVSFLTASVQVRAIAADPDATLMLNATPLVSGELSAPLEVDEGGNRLTLEVTAPNGAVERTTVNITRQRADSFAQRAYIKAFNTNSQFRFGGSVAISGDTLVVGAPLEPSAGTGVNGGAPAGDSASSSGAAYVFIRSGGVWSQQAYLKASNTGAVDAFGWSVAISGDTLVVGAIGEDSVSTGVNGEAQGDNSANDSGAAYVFTRSGGEWSQQAYLKASNTGEDDLFGSTVAISGDTLVVGAPFERSAGTGVNGGSQGDDSAEGAGAAYVFTRSGGVWSQQAYLKASNTTADDQFGGSVAISEDTLVVGAISEDSAGTGVNGGAQGDDSEDGSGAAYVFTRNGAVWSQQAYLKASNTGAVDAFGGSVSISGDTLVVGAIGEDGAATGVNGPQDENSSVFGSGAAYVFARSGGVWSQQAYLKASNTGTDDQFGDSVSISGDTLVVGAPFEQSAGTGVNGAQGDDSVDGAGSAYVFTRSGGVWSPQAYLKASNTGMDDQFGDSVAISGDTLVVGALFEQSAGTGVNGEAQGDDSEDGAGAAYIFR